MSDIKETPRKDAYADALDQLWIHLDCNNSHPLYVQFLAFLKNIKEDDTDAAIS